MYVRTDATNKIIDLDKRIRAIAGGTGASKTISILLVLIDYAMSDRKPTLTSIVSETLPHLKRGAIRDFLLILQDERKGKWIFRDESWNKTDYVYQFPNGSKIEFFGADQPDKVRGPRRDRLFLNEANNIPYETADQLIIRTNECIFMDWNPVSEFWFYTEPRFKEKDVDFITLTYKDNSALLESIVKEIEMHRGNKYWWTVYGEGKLGEMGNQIFREWRIIENVPHEARLVKYGLDFGYSNDPTALIALYYFNGGYIIDEILFQKGLSNKQIADTIKNLPPAVVIADSAEPKSIDEIRLYEISILPTTKGKGSVAQGIQYVQAQRISITKRSVNVIKEYRNYMWQTDKNGKVLPEPEHTWSHSMDAIRYALQSMKPVKKAVSAPLQTEYETPSIAQPELSGRRIGYVQRSLHRAIPTQRDYELPGLG